MEMRIDGAQVLVGDDLLETSVHVVDGQIAGIGGGSGSVIDGRGKYLMPAMVDIHGDAFERQIMPRPGVFFPLDAAILETDRQLAANGIATAYHALTFSWEPGLRSVERGSAFLEGLAAMAPRLSVENRVQLRWETFATEAMEVITRALDAPLAPSVAFNDHTSMSMRDFDLPIQDRAFEHAAEFALADPDDPRFLTRMAGPAKRSGLTPEDYRDLAFRIWKRRTDIPGHIADIAQKARARSVPMLSHDDTQDETRNFYRGLGAKISEFPMRVPVAEAARAAGDQIVFGSPNVLRGGSHIGSPSAADMVEAGLCDILASDYYYPALLAAVGRLHAERRAPLAKLWDLVSGGPARASGLTDRGRIAVGARADLVLVDWPDGAAPAISMTLSGGRIAYLSGNLIS